MMELLQPLYALINAVDCVQRLVLIYLIVFDHICEICKKHPPFNTLQRRCRPLVSAVVTLLHLGCGSSWRQVWKLGGDYNFQTAGEAHDCRLFDLGLYLWYHPKFWDGRLAEMRKPQNTRSEETQHGINNLVSDSWMAEVIVAPSTSIFKATIVSYSFCSTVMASSKVWIVLSKRLICC